jgi:cell division protein FtsI (penicillin-binding protein 3)
MLGSAQDARPSGWTPPAAAGHGSAGVLETEASRRLQWLLWLILAWVAAIFLRLMWLQVFQHDELLRQAQAQQQKKVAIQALRGTIFDRTGQPLAKSLPAESVVVNPRRIPDLDVAAELLAGVLKLDRVELRKRIQAASARGGGFLWVKRKISSEEAARLRTLKLDWVEFRPELRRFYPNHTLASHVIGSTGYVEDAERGNAGIEAAFDEELAGRPGEARMYTDVRQNPYDSVVVRKPEPGANLTLTIDPNLQYIAEKELDKAVASSGAATGTVVVLNPYTGDVLAMAVYPRYDPNLPPGPDEPENARSNLAITTPFEPGSVFKVITLSAALETTNIRPDTMINCGNGSINLFGRIIHDHDRYSALSMADVLAKSSNIGAIQIGLKVGEKDLYDYVTRFGFGHKTGIELPGESSGLLRRVKDWTPSSIGSIAMGHEVSATSIQLALAGAAVANGGLLVKPRLVMGIQREGGPMEQYPPDKPVRILKPETAILMRQMMEGVVLHGTGKRAILKGYTSGGKTGSAQIYDLKAHVYTHTYNSSFLGFAPVTNPQVVISVTLNGTTHGDAGFGGVVAAPVFREVATHALRMLDVPKDLPETSGKPVITSTKDTGSLNDLALAGLGGAPMLADVQPNSARGQDFARNRTVSSVTPPPVRVVAPASAGGTSLDRRPFFSASAEAFGERLVASNLPPAAALAAAKPALGLAPAAAEGPVTPDFRGLTVRAVLEESAALGVPVDVQGSGLARRQDPPPGTILPPRASIRVQFGR